MVTGRPPKWPLGSSNSTKGVVEALGFCRQLPAVQQQGRPDGHGQATEVAVRQQAIGEVFFP